MAEGFMDKLKDKAEGLKDKAEDLKDKAVDKAQEELSELDDKVAAHAEKDGIIGKVADTAHKVIDKVDGD